MFGSQTYCEMSLLVSHFPYRSRDSYKVTTKTKPYEEELPYKSGSLIIDTTSSRKDTSMIHLDKDEEDTYSQP